MQCHCRHTNEWQYNPLYRWGMLQKNHPDIRLDLFDCSSLRNNSQQEKPILNFTCHFFKYRPELCSTLSGYIRLASKIRLIKTNRYFVPSGIAAAILFASGIAPKPLVQNPRPLIYNRSLHQHLA